LNIAQRAFIFFDKVLVWLLYFQNLYSIHHPKLKAQITSVNPAEAYKTVTKVFEIQLNPILLI